VAGLLAQVRLTCARQTGQPKPCRAAHPRAVPLRVANAVTEDAAKTLYDTFAVPASGKWLFQAASANLNPWTEAKVDTKNPDRGPVLIIAGERGNTVPSAIANASFKRQQRNEGVTEIVKIPSRRDSLEIDVGWREVADNGLRFVQRIVKA
jgi:non-heme chloroperoxidase